MWTEGTRPMSETPPQLGGVFHFFGGSRYIRTVPNVALMKAKCLHRSWSSWTSTVTDYPIRIIRHEVVPNCGSFEIQFKDGRQSKFFYWDDVPGRGLRDDQFDQETAKRKAQEFARMMLRT